MKEDEVARKISPSVSVPGLGRREFLFQAAMASALAACPAFFRPGAALAQVADQPTLERYQAALNILARDTMAGVSAFVVPGFDQYSLVQRHSTSSPGGMAADNDEYLVYMFDNYIPLPPPLGYTLGTVLGAPLDGVTLTLPDGTTILASDAVSEFFSLTDTAPGALLVALLLNFVALTVDPTSATGPFPSPFSNLRWSEKAKVFERLEEPGSELISVIDTNFPGPVGAVVIAYSRLIAFGALIFAGFGSYSEWAFLDPETRQLRTRPVGWWLAEYQPFGPVEGWDEFRGYYRGRREAIDA